jgi:chromosome segregation ATPase
VFVAETEKTRAVAAASQGAAEAVAELALAKSAAAEARMVELEREKQDEADRATRLAERVHQLETEALALSTQYQQLDDQGATIRRLEAEQDMHADELRAALEHVAELEQDLGTRTHKVASLERDLASVREVADTVEGAREASVRQHTNLKSQYDLLKTHYEQLSALLEADVKEKTISAEKTRQLLEQRRWRASQEIKVERFV